VHVPADAPGVRRLGQKLVDGRESCRIGFENVAIPATQMLAMNSSADSAIARACRIALAALAGEALGALERALENTKEYLLTRQQFGKPLAQQQVLRHRFADMYMVLQEIESLGLLAAKASASGRPDADLLLRRAKIHVGMAGVKAAESAVQLHGAMGVTEELAVGHCLRRVLTVDSLFGNARQHLELAAPHIAEW
jgi:alkylation response protein AidB-like acyl-CoA dehydrogenase